jgi:type II restriction/modification system DNA methylase subunit YeeA
MTLPRTTLTRGQYAPLLHRSSAAPHSSLPQREARQPRQFLRRDLRQRADYFANLTTGDKNLTTAAVLLGNSSVAFQGPSKVGAFQVSGEAARMLLAIPNPNGRPNSDVLRPWFNGSDITDRAKDHWIIDFGTELRETEAASYEAPFGHIEEHVKGERQKNNRPAYRHLWFRFAEARAGLRKALRPLTRFVVTPRVAKHRVFQWLDSTACTDTRLYVVARSDDSCMGILHSRLHELWALDITTK